MKEFQPHLNEFKSEYYLLYNTFLNEKDWGNTRLAKQYLEKFWLTSKEFEQVKLAQTKVFNSNFQHLPQKVFLPEFELMPNLGGLLFTEEEFNALKLCLYEMEEQNFYIVQNDFGQNDFPHFRIKYPTNISWDELMSGNYISTFLFEMFHNDFFVFGESGLWGKYCANDEDLPINIYGVKNKLVSTFLESFNNVRVINSDNDAIDKNLPNTEIHHSSLNEVINSLPETYKNYYKIH